eukprot:TRINITY_DN108739_c0_g1_i1.p1 TRINITY_DN108739_c0_g1~~TRINITY_DN108739_c0_g1_i1.p1  ORF type:complete len:803 (-),score=173.33 TRINITY_DN108739_c0_g1_i1:109-2517(-)
MLKSISAQINSAGGTLLDGMRNTSLRMGFTLSQKPKEDEGYRETAVQTTTNEPASQRLLEEYAVGEALGEGAFGVVYACTHRRTGQQVAVKMVDKVETPTEVIRREAELMRSLRHKNVVRFHALFFERCFVCIVMDKFSGGDLVDGMQEHMKERGRINCRDIVHISYQMGAAIQYLHSKNIVHRDIKGDNFLLDRSDITDTNCHLALSDFGTAIVLKEDERLSSEVGTRIFWAPEIFARDYGLKVDVWAFGIIMYGLLDGRFPFKDEHDIKKKEPKYPRKLDPVCEDFLRTMLQKVEKERAAAADCMVHSWHSASDGNQSRWAVKRESEPAVKPTEGQDIQPEEIHGGVAERRRELMERLNNEHAKAPNHANTVSFQHCTSLSEFCVPDRRMPGAYLRYEWWDASKVQRRNILAGDGVERTLAEVSKELDRSPQIVGKMLEDHNIDTTKFGVGEAKPLEQLASEVQSGSARLMLDATSHRKLVRVVDVVLLRLYSSVHKEAMLIETGEQYPDGRRRNAVRVPGTKKFPHENAQETAIRVLKDLLGMGECAVHFAYDEREVYEEEMDSPSFPGVRTVYRKEIMQCYVKEADQEILKKFGLPEGTEWRWEDGKRNTKFFGWMSEEEAAKHKVKLRAEGSEEVSGLVMPPVGLNQQDLIAYLQSHGVDISGFGQGTAKSIKEFSRELMYGESSLVIDDEGKVVRVVDQVVLVVVSPSNKTLVQVAHVAPDGAKHIINRLPAAKGRPDESQFVTARRILRKQIRIDENQVRLDPAKARIFEESRLSPSVPGMMTVYRRRFIEANVM